MENIYTCIYIQEEEKEVKGEKNFNYNHKILLSSREM